jgi:hypothetical protein
MADLTGINPNLSDAAKARILAFRQDYTLDPRNGKLILKSDLAAREAAEAPYVQPTVVQQGGNTVGYSPPEPEVAATQSGSHNMTIIESGGTLSGDSNQAAAIAAAVGVTQGTVTIMEGGAQIEDKATGQVTTVKTPDAAQVAAVTKEVDQVSQEVEDLNAEITALNNKPNVSEAETAALLARIEVVTNKVAEVNNKVNATNALIAIHDVEVETRPKPIELKKPKGMAQSMWWGLTPWKEEKGQTASAVGVAQMAAEMLVPVYYTATKWKSMSNTERALSIGMDALSLIPVFGAAGKGAREAAALTRGARIAAAGKATASELAKQVLWPVEMAKTIRHPIVAAKSIGKTTKEMLSGLENVVSPRKLPESVVISTMHSAKLPVSVAGSGADAMKMRDALMVARKSGVSEVAIVAKDTTYELHSVALMKKTGGLAHGAQDISLFDVGLVVKEIPTKGQLEQGLFVAPNPIGRYGLGQAAQAGKSAAQSGIVVTSKEFAEKFASSSNKLFKSHGQNTAEIESVFKVGTQMEKPAQKLYTRIGGERVEIYLAKKLSRTDIVKLKAAGLVESVKNLYEPTLEIKGAGLKNLSKKEVEDLADAVYGTDRNVARNIRRIGEVSTNPRILPSAALRSAHSRATLITVDTRVRGDAVETSKTVKRIEARSGETIDDAVRRTVAERKDVAERKGYTEVTRTESVDTRRTEPDRTEPTTTRIATPERTGTTDRSRTEPSRSEVTRGRTETPRTETPRARAETPRNERQRVETPERGKPREDISKGGRIILPGTPKERRLTDAQLKGAVSWKQGLFWITMYPPYSKENVVYSVKPIEDIRVIAGPSSAYKTATILRTGVSKDVSLDIGAFIARIGKSKKKGRAKLTFRRDTASEVARG